MFLNRQGRQRRSRRSRYLKLYSTHVINVICIGPPGPPGEGFAFGNVAIVDSVLGDDGTGTVSGPPFKTIGAAIAAPGLVAGQ